MLRTYLFAIVAVLSTSVTVSSPATGIFNKPFSTSRGGNIIDIIGGDVAQPGTTPWLVSIRDMKMHPPRHFCGGTILNQNWILTAATCTAPYHTYEIEICLGEYDMSIEEGYELYRMPIRMITHEKYGYFGGPEYNVALIYVNHFSYSKRIQPAPLWPKYCDDHHSHQTQTTPSGRRDSLPNDKDKKKWDHEGEEGTISGWGSNGDGNYSNVVREAKLTILSKDYCQSMYTAFDMESIMCAANTTDKGIAACKWDQGGGFIDKEGYVIGVFSYFTDCASIPGLYVNMTVIAEWLCPFIHHHPHLGSSLSTNIINN